MDTKLELEEELEIWNQFVLERPADDRQKLIARYTPFATMLAAKLFSGRQINEIEFDEFRQYALVGLIEAIDRYDPVYGSSFKTYAGYRIKGAILDGVEKYCERQQQITARARLREERMEYLLREATESQEDSFLRLVDIAVGVAIGYMLEDSGMFQSESGSYEHNIYRSRELSDLTRVMDGLVSTLPEQEQSVIRYHYYQHIRFDHIAEKMQLTKGRISQIHHRALRRMHEHYDHLKLLRTDY